MPNSYRKRNRWCTNHARSDCTNHTLRVKYNANTDHASTQLQVNPGGGNPTIGTNAEALSPAQIAAGYSGVDAGTSGAGDTTSGLEGKAGNTMSIQI